VDSDGKTDKVWLLNVQKKLYQWSNALVSGEPDA
jgi:hypothetical protein